MVEDPNRAKRRAHLEEKRTALPEIQRELAQVPQA
jgi:hypothetical protein